MNRPKHGKLGFRVGVKIIPHTVEEGTSTTNVEDNRTS